MNEEQNPTEHAQPEEPTEPATPHSDDGIHWETMETAEQTETAEQAETTEKTETTESSVKPDTSRHEKTSVPAPPTGRNANARQSRKKNAREENIYNVPVASMHVPDFNDSARTQRQGDSVRVPDAAQRAARKAELRDRDRANKGTGKPADLDISANEGLALADPLTYSPRLSSRVLCAVFGVFFLIMSGAVYWLGVHTAHGQSFDDQAITNYHNTVSPYFKSSNWPFGISELVIAVSVLFGVVAVVIALCRKRWNLVWQLLVFSVFAYLLGHFLKLLLPRPTLVDTRFINGNSAPSGHTAVAIAGALMLLCAATHGWRAISAVIGALYTIAIGLSVIVDQWHRPVDVLMAILLVGGLMLVTLVFTAGSGMDKPGKRVSSPSVQIVATAMITLGICGLLYAGYILWQVEPGLLTNAGWTIPGVNTCTSALVVSTTLLVFGLVLALRQLTAAPMTRLGMVGGPPAPPKQR